ncbi:MAG: ABC transporter permease subunit [Candidatus Sumerlaeia bacterium]|nr:ABC transporter permease subunit [Candidatus Sumerlaeia bacterium]
MTKTLAIALNTFKEAVRNRVLYVLLFFSVLILFGAWLASTLSIERPERIVRDLGVAAINIISGLIAVFVGIGLVYNDLDKKTIYTVVSKPISRWQFLVGKYIGLLGTILVNVLIMTWVFCTVLHLRDAFTDEATNQAIYRQLESGAYEYKGALAHLGYVATSIIGAVLKGAANILSLGFYSTPITEGLFLASVLTMLEMMVIVSFAVLFSSFSTPTLSAFLTAFVWVIGKGNQELYLLAQSLMKKAGGTTETMDASQELIYHFAKFSAHIAPNLELFNQRPQIADFAPVVVSPMALAYGIVYSAGIIAISVLIFERRNFK